MKTYDPSAGTDFHDALRAAADIAAQSHQQVQMTFNSIVIVIDPKSDMEKIHRDWSLAMEGCLPKRVGPFPVATHGEESLARFAEVRADNKRRRKEQREKYVKEAKDKSDQVASRLANAPDIELSDSEGWAKCKENNTDPHGARIVQYAEDWARLMQVEIGGVMQLADVAEELSHDANTDGITRFMYGRAVSMLSKCWVHGEEFREWHNGKYKHDGEGVVNPAIITIG